MDKIIWRQCDEVVTTVLAIPFILTNVVLTNHVSLSNSDKSEESESNPAVNIDQHDRRF